MEFISTKENRMTTRREYTAQEIEQITAAEAQLRAKGLAEEETQRVVDILDSYFQMYRSTPVTVAAVVKLTEVHPGLKWLTPEELKYRKIAAENPAAAQQLSAWLANQKTLVNT